MIATNHPTSTTVNSPIGLHSESQYIFKMKWFTIFGKIWNFKLMINDKLSRTKMTSKRFLDRILFGFHVVCMMYNEESGVTPHDNHSRGKSTTPMTFNWKMRHTSNIEVRSIWVTAIGIKVTLFLLFMTYICKCGIFYRFWSNHNVTVWRSLIMTKIVSRIEAKSWHASSDFRWPF